MSSTQKPPSPINVPSYFLGHQTVWRAVLVIWLFGTLAISVAYALLEQSLGSEPSERQLLRWMIVTLASAWTGVIAVAKCGDNGASPRAGSLVFGTVAMITGLATLFSAPAIVMLAGW